MSEAAHRGHGGFMHGFVFGAIVGAAIVFLLGTKKGKKLLNTLTEEGLEGITELTDLVEEEMEEDIVPPPPPPNSAPEANHHSQYQDQSHSYTTPPTGSAGGKSRRFFRGIPRRG